MSHNYVGDSTPNLYYNQQRVDIEMPMTEAPPPLESPDIEAFITPMTSNTDYSDNGRTPASRYETPHYPSITTRPRQFQSSIQCTQT